MYDNIVPAAIEHESRQCASVSVTEPASEDVFAPLINLWIVGKVAPLGSITILWPTWLTIFSFWGRRQVMHLLFIHYRVTGTHIPVHMNDDVAHGSKALDSIRICLSVP